MFRIDFRAGFSLLASVLLLCVSARVAHAADSYSIGQSIEVREGDTWSPATVLAQEGRKYQVHYKGAGSIDEWVTTDRMRLPGSTSPATQPAKATPPKYGGFKIGDKVEVLWGGLWRKADVLKQTNGWSMVQYAPNNVEWVQPWRLRAVGSTVAVKDYAQPRVGSQLNSPAPKLTPEQQDAIGAHQDQDAENPRRRGRHDADDASAPKPVLINEDGLPLTRCDLSTGRDLEPRGIEAPALPDTIVSATPPKMISLHHGPPAWGTASQMFLHPQGKFAMMVFSPSSNELPSSIQRVELSGGDADGVIQLTNRDYPLAISPDGKRMVARANRDDRQAMWRMDLWNIDAPVPKMLQSFRPYDTGTVASDAVILAYFPDAAHLLTVSLNHVITLWEISDTTVKEIWSLLSDGSIYPQLSPGGKYITVGFDAQIMVMDVLSGKCVGKTAALIDINALTSALRSDAKRVAVVGERRLILIDLERSSVQFDIGMPANLHGSKLAWLGMNLLLIDDHLVFDVEHQAPVWDYTMPGGIPLASLEGEHFWYLAQSNGGAEGNNRSFLTSFALPDARVRAADAKVPDGVPLVKEGMAVSLQVNVDGSAEDRQKIVDRFTRQLTENGITIADGLPTKLICETKAGNSQTKTYRPDVFNRTHHGDETVTVTQTLYRVAFEVDGKEVWAVNNQSGGYLPNMIFEKQNQSAADAVAEQNKPQLSWFLSVILPKTILKPADPIGTSPFASTNAVGRPRNGR
jgi:hypothetical protein